MKRQHSAADCVHPTGKTSTCALIATRLIIDDQEVHRLARRAARSAEAHARYADQLAAAKDERRLGLEWRNTHVSECPAAAARFGVPA